MPTQIKESMVLWYDVSRQGCTNENMAENPVLRDLSGNGHDATCYNFAWSGMSGVGGYKTDYTKYYIQDGRGTLEVTDTKIVIKNVVQNTALIETATTNLGLIPAYKIKVSGIPDGASLNYTYYIDEYKSYYYITSDGEYELPANTYLHEFVGFTISEFTGECNITIEQIPLYPGALVSDGVDDYAMVEGLPILTKEKGFTVIAKRKWISDLNVSLALLYKATDLSFRGAFVLEGITGSGTIKTNYSFGTNNDVEEFESSDITYLTSNSYNGKLIKSGLSEDTDFIEIFRARQLYCSAALYSLLLFNRDLTTEEIEWVKRNLM